MDLLKQFEALIKERTVVFDYDDEDGFFIQVTEKGKFNYHVKNAELTLTHHATIEGAIESAIDFLKKEDKDFEELIHKIENKSHQ